jgi:hypothetical protein
MKFFVVIKNTGEWAISAFAAKHGMTMRRSGCFGGWITREAINELEKSDMQYSIEY